MKKIIIYIALLAVISSGYLNAQEVTITLYHTGDSHSQLDGLPTYNPTEGGLYKIASIVKTAKLTDPNTLFFHSGDFMVGDFFFNKFLGSFELSLLKKIGCDALAVGNHEFDLGPYILYASLLHGFRKGTFPLLSANLNLNGFPELGEFIFPYTYKNISGVKTGIFGLTASDPLNNPSPVIVSDSILQVAAQTVQLMKSSGASIVILLSHLGYFADSVLAANIPYIDFILGGHDHYTTNELKQVVNPSGKITYICHSGDYYRKLGKIKFTYNPAENIIINEFSMISINQSVINDTYTYSAIQSYKQIIEQNYGAVFSQRLGYAFFDITSGIDFSSAARDVPLGNLVTDSYRDTTGSEIAMSARGLISNKLYKGEIFGADILRVVPYGYDSATRLNTNLITCSISGSQLIYGLEIVLEAARSSESFIPQVSGISFDYFPDYNFGQKIFLPSLKINGIPINPSSNYSLTVNEIVLGVLQAAGIQIQNIVNTRISEYVAVRNKILSVDTLRYTYEGRLRDITLITSVKTELPEKYLLLSNYPNPFNSSTVIKFSLNSPGFITIKLYDILGKEVKTLISGNYPSGNHSLLFNSGSLSSGIYFYSLETMNSIVTRKMLLVR